MSTNYYAIIAIGKEFDSKSEVIDFLEEHNILDDENRDQIEDIGLVEWLDCNDKNVYGQLLNYYSGDYYYVGYPLSTSNPDAFKESFDKARIDWEHKFPHVDPDMIKTVQVC